MSVRAFPHFWPRWEVQGAIFPTYGIPRNHSNCTQNGTNPGNDESQNTMTEAISEWKRKARPRNPEKIQGIPKDAVAVDDESFLVIPDQACV
jgi:hypothetical protein